MSDNEIKNNFKLDVDEYNALSLFQKYVKDKYDSDDFEYYLKISRFDDLKSFSSETRKILRIYKTFLLSEK